MRRSYFLLALLIAPLAAAAGCGGAGSTVWVDGKLLKAGASYVPPEGQTVNVTFIGIETQDGAGKTIQSNEPFLADVDQADGSFSVPGPDGRGIPPGKYRVSVVQKMKREALEKIKPKGKTRVDRETDMLANRFGAATSPIVREVKNRVELVIDLDRPTE